MLLFNVNRNISSKRFFTSAPFLSFFPQINMVVPNHTCDWDFEFEPLYAYVCGLCVWFIYFQTYINCLLKCFFFQSQLWLMHMHTCVSVHFICIYSSIRNTPKAVEHGWLVFSSVSLFCDLQNKNNNSKGAEQQRRKQTFAFQQIKGMIRVKKKCKNVRSAAAWHKSVKTRKAFPASQPFTHSSAAGVCCTLAKKAQMGFCHWANMETEGRLVQSIYYGSIGSQDTERLLERFGYDGSFLLRDSSTVRGAYCLCVRWAAGGAVQVWPKVPVFL